MITVMMTGAGAPGMPGILRCLSKKRKKIRLIGADADEHAPSRKEFDRFYTIPMASDPYFCQLVLDLCQRESVDILIPVVTRELSILSENKNRFSRIGTQVAVMEVEKLSVANNKGFLYNALEGKGIKVPRYFIANSVQQVNEAISDLLQKHRGIVVKPVEGNGSRGVRIIDKLRSSFDAYFHDKPDGMYTSKDELLSILSEKDSFPLPLMIMPLLPGKEYSVDIVAKDGIVQAAVCRVGLSVVSSNQTSSMVIDEPRIIEMCRRAVQALELSGNIGFDLKEDEEENAYILEINPRLTGGIVTCLAAGANMPWLGIQSWLGEEVKQPSLVYGVRMQRFWNECFFDVEDNPMDI